MSTIAIAMRRAAIAATIILLTPTLGFSADPACPPSDQKIDKVYYELKESSREVIAERLEDVPGIRTYILLMLDDPNVSMNVKRVIRKALEDEDTRIENLTKELRDLIGMDDAMDAFVSSKIHFLKAMDGKAGAAQTKNEAFAKSVTKITRAQKDKHLIFAPDRKISPQENDVIVLIHELAHIRFDMMLEKNIEQLAQRLPPSLVRKMPDGKFEINMHFYDFLTERYAFETQYEALKEGRGKYFPNRSRHMAVGLGVKDSDMKMRISAKVIKDYEITDPEVLKLKDKPLKSILLGTPFAK